MSRIGCTALVVLFAAMPECAQAKSSNRIALQMEAAEVSIIEAWRAAVDVWGESKVVTCIGFRLETETAEDAPSATISKVQSEVGSASIVRPLSSCAESDPIFGTIDDENRRAWSFIYSDVDVVLKENGVPTTPEGRTWDQREDFNRDRVIPPSAVHAPLLTDRNGHVQFDGVVKVTNELDTEWYYFDLQSQDGTVSIVRMKRDPLIH